MRIRLALAVAATLTLTACGGSDGGGDPKPTATSKTAAAPKAKKDTATLGHTAQTAGSDHPLEGDGGGVLALTPSTVAYVPEGTGQKSEKGTYAVVAYKARSMTAVAAAETVPAESKGWTWAAPDGGAVDTLSGNATSVVPDGFTGAGPVALGTYQWRTQVFDLARAQQGGTLIYTDGTGRSYRWKMPARDAGPQLTRLKAALAK